VTGKQQTALFDARQVADTRCPVPGCQAIRWAGTPKTLTCAWDLELDRKHPRPEQCVNALRPEHTEIPF